MHLFRDLFRKREPAASASSAQVLSPIAKRLAEEFALLQEIEFERNFRADPWHNKAIEDRIVWRELFDLELQEVDEQISHGWAE